MKKLLLFNLSFLVLFFQIQIISAQNTDISAFMIKRHYNHTNTNLIWFTHSAPKYFAEARANFDWNNTLALYIGKLFGNDTLWFIPEVGGLYGEYSGIGPRAIDWRKI